MSFGFSVSDCALLVQLASTVISNSRAAIGEHDEFTREVGSLHIVLRRLHDEASKSESLLNSTNDNRVDELGKVAKNCRRLLGAVNKQLKNYNDLGDKNGTRGFGRAWRSFRFGNFEIRKLSDARVRLSQYKESLSLYLNIICVGSQGRVERHMNKLGTEVREMQVQVNWIVATMQASGNGRDGSILTSYADDDKTAWKNLRRALISSGFKSSTLDKYRDLIKSYLLELGARGVLDERIEEEVDPLGYINIQNEEHIATWVDEQVVEDRLPNELHAPPIGSDEPSRAANRAKSNQNPVVATASASGSVIAEGDVDRQTDTADRSTLAAGRSEAKFGGETTGGPISFTDPIFLFEKFMREQSSDFEETDYDHLTRPVTNKSASSGSAPHAASVEDIMDEDFKPGIHPNCVTKDEVYGSDNDVAVDSGESQIGGSAETPQPNPPSQPQSDGWDGSIYSDSETDLQRSRFDSIIDNGKIFRAIHFDDDTKTRTLVVDRSAEYKISQNKKLESFRHALKHMIQLLDDTFELRALASKSQHESLKALHHKALDITEALKVSSPDALLLEFRIGHVPKIGDIFHYYQEPLDVVDDIWNWSNELKELESQILSETASTARGESLNSAVSKPVIVPHESSTSQVPTYSSNYVQDNFHRQRSDSIRQHKPTHPSIPTFAPKVSTRRSNHIRYRRGDPF